MKTFSRFALHIDEFWYEIRSFGLRDCSALSFTVQVLEFRCLVNVQLFACTSQADTSVIVTTFGVLQDEFLRVLWTWTGTANSTLDEGEIGEAGPLVAERSFLFGEFLARVSAATAFVAASR